MRAPVTASTPPMLVTGRVAPPTDSAPFATSIVGAVTTSRAVARARPPAPISQPTVAPSAAPYATATIPTNENASSHAHQRGQEPFS